MAEMKFDESLQRLEEVVREMEGEELPLEESLARYREGIGLARSCLKKLEEAEKKIEVLRKTAAGKLETKPLSDNEEE
jgi:exodeoxyribonuclease VII small subunit